MNSMKSNMISVGGTRFQPKAFHICLFSCAVASVIYILVFAKYFSKLDTTSKVLKPEGLRVVGTSFHLRRKPFIIMSGALHYFRVHHRQWEDRLLKMKAMGLNTVDIYIPWNIHEEYPGEYDFKDEDYNLTAFLHLVQAYGLYAIVRPGPYICSEWDLGGLPSWLLRDPNMKLRSLYPNFKKAVKNYFEKLIPLLKPYQFSYGGPIIAFQIENEYGSYGDDNNYMDFLKSLFVLNGLEEMFFVCDNFDGLGKYGKLDGVLQTINFMSKKYDDITNKLQEMQPNKPVFVTELWDGWFAHWGEKNKFVDTEDVGKVLTKLLNNRSSFNLYMWHGGTSFGFMNGANANDDGSKYQSDITSYDYDAPIDETGKITQKYNALKEIILKNVPAGQVADNLPWVPEQKTFSSYGAIQMNEYMTIHDLMNNGELEGYLHAMLCSMEELVMDKSKPYGQLFGYVIYKKTFLGTGKRLLIHKTRDFAVVVMNGKIVHTQSTHTDVIVIDLDEMLKVNGSNELVIVVENSGRVNYGKDMDNQRKGILGDVQLDGNLINTWQIYPLDFQSTWVNRLEKSKSWKSTTKLITSKTYLPTLYKGLLYVHGNAPRDTFLSLPGWFKGSVFLNGFNLGRHWNIGPQRTLYIPSERLKRADNTLIIFDLHGQPEEHSAQSVAESDLGQDESLKFLI